MLCSICLCGNGVCLLKKPTTYVGGQAVIEGVMMRGPKYIATAVRTPSGQITVKKDEVHSLCERYPILKKPLLRGTIALYESLVYGMKCLSYSAQAAGEEEEELSRPQMIATMAFSIVLAIVIFLLIPTYGAKFIPGVMDSAVRLNIVEGVLRLLIFLLYIWGISLTSDIRRVYEYHGAEHKTIWTYESGEELTVENVRKQGKYHPRCGTSFMFVLIIIATIVSSIVFSIIDITNPFLRMLAHLILLPLVVGISYEFNRYAGRSESLLSRALRWPGLMVQHLTVFEPDDSMIEVAITAMKAVIPDDGSDEW